MNKIEEAKKIVLDTFKNRQIEKVGVSGDKIYVCAPLKGTRAMNNTDCIFFVKDGEAHAINYSREFGEAVKALSKRDV